jgi:hypothetical protein
MSNEKVTLPTLMCMRSAVGWFMGTVLQTQPNI